MIRILVELVIAKLPMTHIARLFTLSKDWFRILTSKEFQAIQPPCLIISAQTPTFQIFQLRDDVLNYPNHINSTGCFRVTGLNPIHEREIVLKGSVNGLILFLAKWEPDCLYVCNPILNQSLSLPRLGFIYPSCDETTTYGFGVSKYSSQYKVIRIFQEGVHSKTNMDLLSITSDFQVLTLGKGNGMWRKLDTTDTCNEYVYSSSGIYMDGSLHWLVWNLETSQWRISSWEVEKEVFTLNSTPPNLPDYNNLLGSLTVLSNTLCMVDSTPTENLLIWHVDKYGKWSKRITLAKGEFGGDSLNSVNVFKMFNDGDVLMWYDYMFLYYSSLTGTTTKDDFLLGGAHQLQPLLYQQSFLSPQDL